MVLSLATLAALWQAPKWHAVGPVGNQPIHMAYMLAPLLLRLRMPSLPAGIRLLAQAGEVEQQKEQLGW